MQFWAFMYAAAVSDANAGAMPVGSSNMEYRPAHMPFEMKNGACLIAVRGGDAIQFATSMDASSTAMEDWLGEPAIRRNLLMGGRARLKHVAGQIIAAWSPELHDLAVRGDLDVALAHQVDQLIARFGLQGHRVAAYLHVDSTSGHPHLHLNFARVRDSDLSLWSLEGRQRAAALWVHGRSNTVRLRGAEALVDDVDALGATSPAARAAELLMSSDNLSATRSLLTGHEERISLQGSAAAQRVTAVGSYHNALGGGLWKFGLGEDPEDMRRWKEEVRQATKTGHAQRWQRCIPANRRCAATG